MDNQDGSKKTIVIIALVVVVIIVLMMFGYSIGECAECGDLGIIRSGLCDYCYKLDKAYKSLWR